MYIMNDKTFEVKFRLTKEQIEAACAEVKNPFVFEMNDITLNDMVNIYNKATGSNIKKFSSRQDAAIRLAKVLSEVPDYTGAAAPAKPTKGAKAKPTKEPKAAKAKPAKGKAKEAKPAKPANASTASRAAAAAKSWADANVYKARTTRHHVTVNGEKYRSTGAAFQALGLPMGIMIPFRMELKAAGKKVLEHGGEKYKFTAQKQES